MASLRRLVYIFIPILAVLLMSHNTFALENEFNPVTCYDLESQGVTCVNTPVSTGYKTRVVAISKTNNPSWSISYRSWFIWTLRVRSEVDLTVSINNGFPENAELSNIDVSCNQTTDYFNTCNIVVVGLNLNTNFNIQLAGNISAAGGIYTIESVYFATQSDFNRLNYISNALNDIRTYLNNHPTASAQDIANAIENTAEQNTQNAANDSQTAGSSSSQDATTATSSLISTIGGFVSAVTAASPTNCVINGNMGHLNMGNLDLCSNPVPSYIQIIGSIILICAVIPLAIILFNRFIGLFRSFQG